jgi:hypothetical protein
MPAIDVYVIDDSRFDLTMFVDSALTWNDVGVRNLRDMADKLVKLCLKGDRIAELRIVGHGNEIGQYVGSEWLTEASLGTHRAQLGRISSLFTRVGQSSKRAHVIMGGCQQGRNGGFLLALSNILSVPVSGFTAMQRPVLPGDEGGRTTCYITCNRQGRTKADGFDDAQMKVVNWVRNRF